MTDQNYPGENFLMEVKGTFLTGYTSVLTTPSSILVMLESRPVGQFVTDGSQLVHVDLTSRREPVVVHDFGSEAAAGDALRFLACELGRDRRQLITNGQFASLAEDVRSSVLSSLPTTSRTPRRLCDIALTTILSLGVFVGVNCLYESHRDARNAAVTVPLPRLQAPGSAMDAPAAPVIRPLSYSHPALPVSIDGGKAEPTGSANPTPAPSSQDMETVQHLRQVLDRLKSSKTASPAEMEEALRSLPPDIRSQVIAQMTHAGSNQAPSKKGDVKVDPNATDKYGVGYVPPPGSWGRIVIPDPVPPGGSMSSSDDLKNLGVK